MHQGQPDLERTVVHFRCVAPDHLTIVSLRSGLMIHADRWAYCPAGSPMTGEHQWAATGGRPIAEVRELTTARDDALLAALTAAEALHAELRRAVGVTSFRLEIARPGSPFSIELGEPWPVHGRERLEMLLTEGIGQVAKVSIGDARRGEYDEGERRAAYKIASTYATRLRWWNP